ncbi:Hypothetical predicted protein, partial [Mytilus galloprovincialis]
MDMKIDLKHLKSCRLKFADPMVLIINVFIFSVVVTGCYVGGGTVSAGPLKFPDIKTSIRVSNLSSFKSTGKFTCQVPGYYYIAVTLMSADANTKIEIMKNSAAIHWQFMTGYTKEQTHWEPGATVVALELKSNDN